MTRLGTLRPQLAKLDTSIAPLPPKQSDPFYLSSEWRALVDKIKRQRGDACEGGLCWPSLILLWHWRRGVIYPSSGGVFTGTALFLPAI